MKTYESAFQNMSPLSSRKGFGSLKRAGLQFSAVSRLENNIFFDAFEMLCGLGQMKRLSGYISVKSPGQVTGSFQRKISSYCEGLSGTEIQAIDEDLAILGEYLMFQASTYFNLDQRLINGLGRLYLSECRQEFLEQLFAFPLQEMAEAD